MNNFCHRLVVLTSGGLGHWVCCRLAEADLPGKLGKGTPLHQDVVHFRL